MLLCRPHVRVKEAGDVPGAGTLGAATGRLMVTAGNALIVSVLLCTAAWSLLWRRVRPPRPEVAAQDDPVPERADPRQGVIAIGAASRAPSRARDRVRPSRGHADPPPTDHNLYQTHRYPLLASLPGNEVVVEDDVGVRLDIKGMNALSAHEALRDAGIDYLFMRAGRGARDMIPPLTTP